MLYEAPIPSHILARYAGKSREELISTVHGEIYAIEAAMYQTLARTAGCFGVCEAIERQEDIDSLS